MKALLVFIAASAIALQAQPRVQSFTLPNGLRVLHLEDHEHPLVWARLFLRIESNAVPAGLQGLPLLFQGMFDHGETADLKAGELDRILDDSGIQLTQSLGKDGFTWRLVARSRDQDRALGLLADRLLRTLLDPALLETQRLACRRQLDQPWESPRTRLRQRLAQNPASRPTADSLGAITLQDLLDFRASALRPDHAILVLLGDLGLEQAKRMVLLSLGPWTVQPPPAPRAPLPGPASAPAPTAPGQVPQIPSPGTAVQAMAVAPRPADIAREPAALLSLLVPGDARLNPARVSIKDGCLVATLDGERGAPRSGLESLLRGRLEAFRQKGFLQADLEGARTAWFARRSLASLHPEALVDRVLAEALGHGVDEDRMKALSLEALNESLRQWLEPASLRIGAVGEPGN